MRIGIMLRTLDEPYGIGHYTRNLLANLLPLDQRNEYVLLYSNLRYLGSHADHPHVEERVLRARGKLLWDQWAVPRAARREGLELLFHTKFTVPLLAPCPTAMVLHGSEWFVYPENSTWADLQYIRRVLPLYLRKAGAVLAVSERAKKDIERYTSVDPRKVHTVHLAVNERYRRVEDASSLASVRERLGLPESFLLFVGKIYPGKNLGNVLRALDVLRDRIPHHLVVCGAPYYKYEEDLRLIEELGLAERVLRPGWVDPEDLPAMYTLATALVFPSRYESCPSPPWEAMACDCPVVTSATGGTPEVVGEAGLYVDPEDPRGIAEGVLRVIEDGELRERLVSEGRRQVRRFSWERTARATLAVLEGLLQG